jgi:CheY-like chemotaxis protein
VETPRLVNEVGDDRENLRPGDRVLLIVENDLTFARILLQAARERGFKGLVAGRGDAALAAARRCKPDAVTLDIRLPDMDGWVVLERLKQDLGTRHIPVHIISAVDEGQRGLRLGAFAQLKKPVTRQALADAFAKIQGFLERRAKKLLVVEAAEDQRRRIAELIGDGDVQIATAATGDEALAVLAADGFVNVAPSGFASFKTRVQAAWVQRARAERRGDSHLFGTVNALLAAASVIVALVVLVYRPIELPPVVAAVVAAVVLTVALIAASVLTTRRL